MLTLMLCMLFQDGLPTVVVEKDNTAVAQSCRIAIESDSIADADGNGVIQITGSDITVDFAGARLHGAAKDALPDTFSGYGVRITGTNVTLKNANISGYKGGIFTTAASGLTIEGCDLSGNFQQHLRSTPAAEDGGDWLWPHKNDGREWLTNYGAAIYVERSHNVTIRDCRARHGQNGILLDRVTDSKIYDNDFSFLSGWGLGLWRCERNIISRNAFDFCVRGYSHGVYNRGQDSAGMLVFEQNIDNIIVENSATHGGDGFFAFAGHEALGENPPPTPDFDYKRRGNRGNIIANNDFSYAPAHGIELTFSFDNKLIGNRLVGNAICGVWGGYSQDTVIAGNQIENNGEMGYGQERGGVNIEHGQRNWIVNNAFKNNKCGVHLWWDADEGLIKTPWARANGAESRDNVIAGNTFDGDQLALHLRDTTGTVYADNKMTNVGRESEIKPPGELSKSVPSDIAAKQKVEFTPLGKTKPVGARKHLWGRDKIVVTEWGPYDWEGPYLQYLGPQAEGQAFRLLGKDPLEEAAATGDVTVKVSKEGAEPRVIVSPKQTGTVCKYGLKVRTAGTTLSHTGVIIGTTWNVKVFSNQTDPRKDIDGWHKEAEKSTAFTTAALELRYGGGGPSSLKELPKEVADAKLPNDHFGTIATTELTLPAGKWRLATESDDGVRVYVDDKPLIDNWTWHGPTKDTAELTLDQPRKVSIRVEHFELDGFSVLTFGLEPLSE